MKTESITESEVLSTLHEFNETIKAQKEFITYAEDNLIYLGQGRIRKKIYSATDIMHMRKHVIETIKERELYISECRVN